MKKSASSERITPELIARFGAKLTAQLPTLCFLLTKRLEAHLPALQTAVLTPSDKQHLRRVARKTLGFASTAVLR